MNLKTLLFISTAWLGGVLLGVACARKPSAPAPAYRVEWGVPEVARERTVACTNDGKKLHCIPFLFAVQVFLNSLQEGVPETPASDPAPQVEEL